MSLPMFVIGNLDDNNIDIKMTQGLEVYMYWLIQQYSKQIRFWTLICLTNKIKKNYSIFVSNKYLSLEVFFHFLCFWKNPWVFYPLMSAENITKFQSEGRRDLEHRKLKNTFSQYHLNLFNGKIPDKTKFLESTGEKQISLAKYKGWK